jgi:hypothetical protein
MPKRSFNTSSGLAADGNTFTLNPIAGSLWPVKGAAPITFTRNSVAAVTDWEGLAKPAPAGAARFDGLRMVRNQAPTSSENLSNYSKLLNGTGTAPVTTWAAANTITYNGVVYPATRATFALNGGTTANDRSFIQPPSGFDASKWRTISVIVQSATGSTYIMNYRVGATSKQISVTPTPQRFALTTFNDTDATCWLGLRGAQSPTLNSDSADILITAWQMEDVSGMANKNPSEYVPIGAFRANELINSTNILGGNWTASNVNISASQPGNPETQRITLINGSASHLFSQSGTAGRVPDNAYIVMTGRFKGDGVMTTCAYEFVTKASTFAPHRFNPNNGNVGTTAADGFIHTVLDDGSVRITAWKNGGTGAGEILRYALYVGGYGTFSGDGQFVDVSEMSVTISNTVPTAHPTYTPVGTTYLNNGANADGVQYFNYLNGTTANPTTFLVTEGKGEMIPVDGYGVAYLPGTASSIFSSVDAGLNSILGDIDIRVKAALIDWTPTAQSLLISKENNSDPARAWRFGVNTDGTLHFSWFPLGTTASQITTSSTAANTFVDGTINWIRATLDVDNGASGNTVTFYTSSDGVTWTQLGNTVVTASTTTLFDTTSPVYVGGRDSTNLSPMLGNVYYAEVRKGIAGPIVSTFNPSDWSNGASWYSSATGEFWTSTGGAKILKVPCKGILLEDPKTNLILQSEDLATTWTTSNATVTTNATWGADGAFTADKIVEAATTSQHGVTQNITKAASAITYTGSVFFKAAERTNAIIQFLSGANGYYQTFNLNTGVLGTAAIVGSGFAFVGASMIPYGNGWWRCTFTITSDTTTTLTMQLLASDGTLSYLGVITNGVYAWGAQLEQASFASSYIPTTTVSLTRAADVLNVPTLGTWFNQTQGTIVTEAAYNVAAVSALSTFQGLWQLNDGSGSNRIGVRRTDGNGTQVSNVFAGSAQQAATTGPVVTDTSFHKFATAWNTSDLAAIVDGGLSSTGAPASIPVMTRLDIATGQGFNQNTCYVRSFKYYNSRLPDLLIKQLSQIEYVPTLSYDFTGGSIVPKKLPGGPTFTRATVAYVQDFEGNYRRCLSGEARFEGLRRVHNYLTFTEDFSNAAWVVGDPVNNPKFPNTNDIAAPDGTFTACKWVLTSTAGNRAFSQSVVDPFSVPLQGRTLVFSYYVYVPSSNSAGTFNSYMFSNTDIPTDQINLNNTAIIPRNTWTRVRYKHTFTSGSTSTLAASFHGNFADTAGDMIYVWHPMLEDVTDQINHNPSEYVSNGVQPSPYYHGANVDGVKYFNTINANYTVGTSFVVNDVTPTVAIPKDGFGYAVMNANTSNESFSTPDTAANSIVGDLDIQAYIAPASWTPATISAIVSKISGAASGYMLALTTSGQLQLYLNSTASIDATSNVVIPTVLLNIAPYQGLWVRCYKQVTSGRVTFYYSHDGNNWTQLGAAQAGTAGAINDNALALSIGVNGFNTAQTFNGKIGRVLIYAGNVLKVDFNPSQWSSGSTWTGWNGETWTIGSSSYVAKQQLRGLMIEEGRTNSSIQAADLSTSWTPVNTVVVTNQVLAPDGSFTADKLRDDATATVQHGITFPNAVSFTSASIYSASVYAKAAEYSSIRIFIPGTVIASAGGATFSLLGTGSTSNVGAGVTAKIDALPLGWYRCQVSWTASATTTANLQLFLQDGTTYSGTGTNGVYLWSAMVELGSHCTSPIITTTGSAARNPDVFLIGNPITSWFNNTEWSQVAELTYGGVGAVAQMVTSFTNAGLTEDIGVQRGSFSNAINADIRNNSVAQGPVALTAPGAFIPFKFAFAFRQDNFAGSASGGAIVSDTSGLMPGTGSPIDRAYLGSFNGSVQQFNGYFRSFRYYNFRVPDAALPILST